MYFAFEMKKTNPDYIHFEASIKPIHEMKSEHVIFIPHSLLTQMGWGFRTRLEGEINGFPFNLAIQKTKEHEFYLMVGLTLRRRAKLIPEQPFNVKAKMADTEKVIYPEELMAVLDTDAMAHKKFFQLTHGKQRGLCHYVDSVNNTESRIKRALHIAEKTKMGDYD